MRHIGGDVKKVASSSDEMLFESLAEPHPGFSAEDVNGSFMVLVLVHLGSFTGWNSRDLQMDSCAPTDWAEIPGAKKCPCLPRNSAAALTTWHVGLPASIFFFYFLPIGRSLVIQRSRAAIDGQSSGAAAGSLWKW